MDPSTSSGQVLRRGSGQAKIGICLAGFGNFGKKLYGYLEKMPEFQVKYLYHPDPKKSVQYGPLGISDLSVVLEDPEIEAFVIATPHDQHAPLLKIILAEGKHHIFVEKPMTATFEETFNLNFPQKVFMVGHCQRREAVFRKAKELLDKNEIGKIVDVHFNFSHGGAYNIGKDNWRSSSDRNREGSLAVLGSHAIDTIHYLFGRTRSVCAHLDNVSKKTESPDRVSVMMQMENRTHVFLSSNYCVPSEKYCFISGTEGVIYIARDKIYLRLGRDANRMPTSKIEIPVKPIDAIQEELQEFADAILHGKKVETGYGEGLAVMNVVGACSYSSIQYGIITLS